MTLVEPCSDLTLELPFTLTHPKPKPVICQMITLPSRQPTEDSSSTLTPEHTQESPDQEPKEGEGEGVAKVSEATLEPRPSLTSIYDAIDHNLINFDT